MKEQFLNLTGLTELVGYLKTSIANHKEILPYASNKLFPSVGDINIIYIDTDTNTIYRWDSSSKTYITLAKAVKSVTISEATENGKITLTVDGNKTTVPIHGLGSAAYTNSSAYSPAGHTHTKAQVGLGNVDNTADANKNVKHATTADSATIAGTATNVSAGEGTADAARHVWFSDSTTETKRAYSDKFKYNPVTNNLTVNVTGNATTATSANKLNTNAGSATKPVYFSGGVPVACSYTLGKSVPADALFTDHTYGNMKGATSSAAGSAGLVPAPNIGEQLKFLRADGTWVIPTNTTYSVGTSNYSGITKLYTETGSATDGTMTQKAITTALNGKSATGHTHAYAGSSSAGGAATSAIKLSTPRKIGNASFDGSSDITLAQMGVYNPIEITKADYENLKKSNKIDMSAYYNIIDDYDSIDIINDEYISSNQVFSSSKIDSVYSKKSISYNITLESQKWVKKNDKYQYVLSANEITKTNIIEINYSPNATADEINAYQKAYLKDGGQSKGQGILLADIKPAISIPITVIIRNDL